jgi:molybdate transport repressor ModE-like protein
MLDLTRLRVLDAVARHGSVTAAARELHYSQPSVSHHLARLEQETGAALLQRVGRGVRLTQAGQVLAERAAEILGRVSAAAAELSAHVGLDAGRVRLAGFSSALSTLVPTAVATLAGRHPGLELSLVDCHPDEALDMLRTGQVDVAVIFRYDETADEERDFRLVHLLDDPTYVVGKARRNTRNARNARNTVAGHRESSWIGGCERCQTHLLAVCDAEGFVPQVAYVSDDVVVMQALAAAGMGVTILPGMALRAHRVPGLTATEHPGATREVLAATYGQPPDPPPIAAVVAALRDAARDLAV